MLAALRASGGSSGGSTLEQSIKDGSLPPNAQRLGDGGGGSGDAAHDGSQQNLVGGGEASSSMAAAMPVRPNLKKLISSGGASAMSAFVMAGKAARWRRHQIVTEALDKWWVVMQRHLASVGKLEEGLDFDEYLNIFKKVYKALVERYDEAEAYAAVSDDWNNDAHGEERLPASRVRDGAGTPEAHARAARSPSRSVAPRCPRCPPFPHPHLCAMGRRSAFVSLLTCLCARALRSRL